MRDIKFRAYNFNLEAYAPDHASFNFGEEDCVVFDFFDGNFDTKVWGFDECYIEQYTGLKDKNGVEIYEGDIVDYNGASEVVFIDGCFNVKGFYETSQDYPTMAFSESYSFKVIGNIHESPELLK